MKKYILELFDSSGDLSVQQILLHLLVAAVIGFVIYLSYRLSHNGAVYSKKFNVSLVVLTVLTATVMTVIGNNIALSLGMVGALSIIRFRTAIKDSRDAVYIFWTIIVGICCGVGDYEVAGIGSAAVFLILLFLGRIQNDNRMLIIIRCARVNEERVQALIFKYFARRATLRVKNTTDSSVEFIYELSKRTLKLQEKQETSITDAVYEIGNVEYMNIVMQNDEISS
ncbi:MAG: DUF4956 domain-containing protein [Clostridiales bacterium]|nr:DUF4956 domain-containing protein [Clostridiales bacterium]